MTGDGKRIALIGAGHMGGALAAGWLRKARGGLAAEELLIVDPDPGDQARALIAKHGVKSADKLGPRMAADVGMVVIAVKPQVFDAAAAELAAVLKPDCAVLSILAGVQVRRIEEVLGQRPVIRAMPNMAASIGKGVTVCYSNEAGEAREKDAERLLKVGGAVEWVRDERMMGAVTAVSGSGPAYVFLMAEALAGAGVAEGLPRELAEKLARATIIGAGALLEVSKDSPQTLRRAVTSPGGTTQAALDIMMGEGGLPDLMRHAVNAAERRSRRLSGGNGRY